jgi:hypothetical protein
LPTTAGKIRWQNDGIVGPKRKDTFNVAAFRSSENPFRVTLEQACFFRGKGQRVISRSYKSNGPSAGEWTAIQSDCGTKTIYRAY